MTDERPQPPQDEPAAASKAPEQEQSDQEQPAEAKGSEEMTYAQYLKLTHPDKSAEEIAKMVRKENRYTWLVRFQILAFLLIIIVIVILIFTN